ncbi:MAG: bifunctional pyr operon transcriptional regulator/uracil phosphoribosyltransferase PyrR [Mycobacteriales bacterium]
MSAAKPVIDAEAIARTITRLAHQILEHTTGGVLPALMGIPTRGEPLASRIAERMRQLGGVRIFSGSLDVTAYRDDASLRGPHRPGRTVLPADGVDDAHIVLVDDVLYSGRTVRAALDALREFGRPAVVQLAVLVDRGHRELPIRADYVGKNLPTSRQESVRVQLTETDGTDAVLIINDHQQPVRTTTMKGGQ